MTSYKIYINGELYAAYGLQADFKEAARILEAKHDVLFNAPSSFLQSNVKTR